MDQHSEAEKRVEGVTTSRRRPEGRLGVLMPGMGAVATTFIGGVLAIRQGLGLPIGALSQMGTLPMAAEAGGEIPIKNLLPLARLEDLVFGGWDIFPENMHTAALKAGVLAPATLAHIKADLERIRPMPAVFDRACVRQIEGPHVKQAGSKMALAEQLRDDIRSFKAANDLDRAVMVWCASTESYGELAPVHQSLSAFEEGLETSHPAIVPSMIYAYAAIREGVPFANGAPNLTEEIPALQDLAAEAGVPISGKDFKSGQTMIKTVLAPAFKARLLGVSGWFSTNILGNRDGLVLRDAEALKSKQVSKLSALEQILDAQVYPDLYSDMYHTVDINYYPPRGDNKEGWDNIDIFGWLGYPMQIKIDFLCRDSILAAPLVLDVALFMDLAARCGLTGLQDWLAFYYKRPILAAGARAEHDLFRQLAILQDRLRTLADLAVPARGVSGEMAVN